MSGICYTRKVTNTVTLAKAFWLQTKENSSVSIGSDPGYFLSRSNWKQKCLICDLWTAYTTGELGMGPNTKP